MKMPALLRRRGAAASALLIMAVTRPLVGDAQPGIGDETERLRAEIASTGIADPRSAELIEPLTALGLLYRDDGNMPLAIATLTRAIDVVRVNEGLSSLDQAPLMRHLIDVHESFGDARTAWDLEQELIELAYSHPDDPRAGVILRDFGDARIDLLQRYLAGDLPPQIFFGCYYEAPDTVLKDCTSGSKSVAARHVLLQARRYYEDAIEAMRHAPDAIRDIAALEQRLLETNAVFGHYLEAPMRYEFGRQRLEKLYRQRVEDGDPVGDQIAALVEIADWELVYSRNGPALDLYADAFRMLRQQDPDHHLIDELFAPDVPVIVPAFLPNPLSSVESEATIGHVDIEFEISRYGRSRKIRVVAASDDVPRDTIDRLARLIATNRFRPRISDGDFSEATVSRLRYFVDGSREAD